MASSSSSSSSSLEIGNQRELDLYRSEGQGNKKLHVLVEHGVGLAGWINGHVSPVAFVWLEQEGYGKKVQKMHGVECHHSKDPVWNENYIFDLASVELSTLSLHLAVYDGDKSVQRKLLGSCTIPLRTQVGTFNGTIETRMFPLNIDDGKRRDGAGFVAMQLVVSGPFMPPKLETMHSILDSLDALDDGQLFVDESFEGNQALGDVNADVGGIVWKRAGVEYKVRGCADGEVPPLFAHRATGQDVALGLESAFEHCVFGALKDSYRALVKYFADMVAAQRGKSGLYAFTLLWNNGWHDVVVDSRVPCSADGGPLFAHGSGNARGIWVEIIEKAYAKLAGSYAAFFASAERTISVLATLHARHIEAYDARSLQGRVRDPHEEHGGITIRAPDVVFARDENVGFHRAWLALTDLDNYSAWNTFTSRVDHDGPLGVGQRITLHVKMGEKHIEAAEKIDSWIPASPAIRFRRAQVSWGFFSAVTPSFVLHSSHIQTLTIDPNGDLRLRSWETFHGMINWVVKKFSGADVMNGFTTAQRDFAAYMRRQNQLRQSQQQQPDDDDDDDNE